jgi:hypothetical protein
MTHFTTDNTEGFSAADLATLNAAHDLIAAAEPGMDEKSIDDAITNSWIEGMTVDRLVAAALGRPGAV